MEHEDNNTQFNKLFPHTQNLMENIQIASGDDVLGGDLIAGDGFVACHAGNIEGKFEEHKEQCDEEEWKYIKEVQQTEKQQQPMRADNVVGIGNDANAALLGQREFEVGNGNGFGHGEDILAHRNGGVAAAAAFEEDEVEIIKNDGDFSTTSNTTSTAGEEETGERLNEDATDVLQMEMKNEEENSAPREEIEEEEASSLATNTTNGTSSLSENPTHQQQQQQQQQHQTEQFGNIVLEDDKENADPRDASSDIDFELHSQLNPDAKEFVPNFSNPTTPTSTPFSGINEAFVSESVTITTPEGPQQPPSAVPRYLANNEDDLLAQSPRKGRCSDMDAIALPAENEFENEVAKRPHQLEKDNDLIVDAQEQDLFSPDLLANFETNSSSNAVASTDCYDFQSQSPASFLDHGPETSVDLDIKLDYLIENDIGDVIQQTHYGQHIDKEPIEVLLNTVQTLPIEDGEEEIAHGIGDKELLHVEEKEHVSHSPSTEEMAMNIQNELHSSARDIPQIPNDMQESFYMEHTSADAQLQSTTTLLNFADNETDTLFSLNSENAHNYGEVFETTIKRTDEANKEVTLRDAFAAINLNEDTSAPQSTVEKHLVEETKETANLINEQKVYEDELQLSNNICTLPQAEDVATSNATAHSKLEDPFSSYDRFQMQEESVQEPRTQPEPEPDFIPQNEQIFPNEQQEHEQKTQEDQFNELLTQKAAAEPLFETSDTVKDIAVASLSAATAATTLAVAANTPRKSDTGIRKSGNATSATCGKPAAAVKPRLNDKKPLETKKANAVTTSKSATTNAAARPRTAPSKTTSTTTIGAGAGAGATKKPLGSAATSRTALVPPKTARPSTAGAERVVRAVPPNAKPTTTTTTTTKTIKHRSPVSLAPNTAKPRTTNTTSTTNTTTTASAKTSTTGLLSTATAKPKLSPRSTLTSQLRKATPAGSTAATSSTKNATQAQPLATVPTTNGHGVIKQNVAPPLTIHVRSSANRTARTTTKTSTATSGSATSVTTTKCFTARPAPKTSTSSITTTTTTTARRTLANSNTIAAPKTSAVAGGAAAPLRKITLNKSPSARVPGKITPNKAAAPLKLHTKEANKISGGGGNALAAAEKQKQTELLLLQQDETPKTNGADCNVSGGGAGDAQDVLNGDLQKDVELLLTQVGQVELI